MSIGEFTALEIKTFKPNLKYKLGQQVWLKSDEKKRYPLIIVDFQTDDNTCDDYFCRWFNSQGGIENGSFPEECLILKNND